jgi:hypothetical protein
VDTICRGIVKYGDIPAALDPFMVRALGLLKHAVLATDRFGHNVWLDTCSYFRSRLESATTGTISQWMYPALYEMSRLTDQMPLPMPLKTNNVDIEGIFTLSTGIELLVWIVSFYIGKRNTTPSHPSTLQRRRLRELKTP